MKINIQRRHPEMVMPKKATEGSAAYDVYLPEDTAIYPNKRQVIPLGFSLEIPFGYEAKIEPRSGFSSKGIEDKDGHRKDADVIQGKIDSDYRGCVGVIVHSHESYPFLLSKGTRIAQMTFYKVETVNFDEVEALSETSRGTGGFGSSGKGK